MERIVAVCALAKVFGYRIRGMVELLESYITPEELVRCEPYRMREYLGERAVTLDNAIREGVLSWAEDEIKRCSEGGIGIAAYDSALYPKLLRECCDAPLMIYYRGNLEGLAGMEWFSIVGTRKPTAYGCSACVSMTERICHGNVIVSGLAYGIDKIAHETALREGTGTVGVMATGADRIYPAAHISLARKIIDRGGAVISDFPLGTRPVAVNFLRRNRIIAGASHSTLVIESPVKGGSMVTATEAFSYNRNLYAVPGNITSPCSQGCNYLISCGMAECAHCPSIFGELNFPENELSPAEKRVLATMGSGPGHMSAEQIASECRMDIGTVSAVLTELELKREICNEDGINWSILIKK